MIRHAPRYLPLWLARRQWFHNRGILAYSPHDGMPRGEVFQVMHRNGWDLYETGRSNWRLAPGWQRARALLHYGCHSLPF